MAESTGKNRTLKAVLSEIGKNHVTIETESQKKNVKTMTYVIETVVIQKLKEVDKLFGELYSRIYYTGSYFDGLRTTEATEFDLDLVLKLPFKKENIQVSGNSTGLPGYVEYKLKEPIAVLLAYHPKWNDVYINIEKTFFKNNYLMQGLTNQWMQRVVDLAVKDLAKNDPSIKIQVPGEGPVRLKLSSSGPARTLQLYIENRKTTIDVDLVPTIEFDGWPPGATQRPWYSKMKPADKLCLLVPKPISTGNVPPEIAQRLWRVALPKVEGFVLDDMGCTKPLIKIFKVLRDKRKWKSICSYYIKTLILWEISKHYDKTYWAPAKMDTLFMDMLLCLQNAIKTKEIRSFHYPTLNLLRGLSNDEAKNISNAIERIIKDINVKPEKLLDYF